MHLRTGVPAVVPAVALQRVEAVGGGGNEARRQAARRNHGGQVRQGRGQLRVGVLGVEAHADVQPLGDLHGHHGRQVHRQQLGLDRVVAGEVVGVVFGGEVVRRLGGQADGEAITDRQGDGEVRHHAALHHFVDVLVAANGGASAEDRAGRERRGRRRQGVRQGRAGVVDVGIDDQAMGADVDFAAAAGDRGGVPPQGGRAHVGAFARVGAADAAHRLFLQIERAGRSGRGDGGGRSGEQGGGADAAEDPGGHVSLSPKI